MRRWFALLVATAAQRKGRHTACSDAWSRASGGHPERSRICPHSCNCRERPFDAAGKRVLKRIDHRVLLRKNPRGLQRGNPYRIQRARPVLAQSVQEPEPPDPARRHRRAGKPRPRVAYTDIEATWHAPWKAYFTFGVRNALDRTPPISYLAFANSFFPEYEMPGRFSYVRYRQQF